MDLRGKGGMQDLKMDNRHKNFLIHVGWDHQGSLVNSLNIEHFKGMKYFFEYTC